MLISLACFIYIIFYFCNLIVESFKCADIKYYTYIDLDNNKGRAIDCDKNFQPYLTCELEDDTIIQVKEYKREFENKCK